MLDLLLIVMLMMHWYLVQIIRGTEKVRIDSSGRLYLGSNFTGGNGDVDDLVISGTGHKGYTL